MKTTLNKPIFVILSVEAPPPETRKSSIEFFGSIKNSKYLQISPKIFESSLRKRREKYRKLLKHAFSRRNSVARNSGKVRENSPPKPKTSQNKIPGDNISPQTTRRSFPNLKMLPKQTFLPENRIKGCFPGPS